MEHAARTTTNENLQTQLNRIQNELLEVSAASTSVNPARTPLVHTAPRTEDVQLQRQQAQAGFEKSRSKKKFDQSFGVFVSF